jgi:pyridoxal biosynthesis lyase PdxS
VQADHTPLTVILKTREVNKLTNRLQGFRMRLLKFNFDISYVPGSKLYVADALSRAPLQKGSTMKTSRHKMCTGAVKQDVDTLRCSEDRIRASQKEDEAISQEIMTTGTEG